MIETIIGIDLGTTNSVVSYIKDGQPTIIPVDGEPTMPSCVGIDPEDKLLVGREARNQYTVYPERTILSIKRKMGMDITVMLGDKTFCPEEISALILKKLKSAAEAHLNTKIKKAVITVPAYFDEPQRKATRIAGEIAELEIVNILNEPTAAALAYGVMSESESTFLVYDLGGGTFDASLVVNESNVVEVKSSHGDTELGGDDFDQLLVRRASEAFENDESVFIKDDPIAKNRLKVAMEAAKIKLSVEPFVTVEEAFLSEGKSLQVEISREDYQSDIYPLLEKTVGCCAQCLNDAAMKASDLDRILLVGGSSRTPLVYELLRQRFNVEVSHEINPDLVVAYGAALQGASIAGEKTSGVLIDITPHNLGMLAIGSFGEPVFSMLIPRNTPLPARQAKVYWTNHDKQKEALIEVFQGAFETLEQNNRIGELQITDLSPVPAGNQIIVDFKLNLNGMLEVTAKEKKTGLEKRTFMDTHVGDTDIDIETTTQRINELSQEEDLSFEENDHHQETTSEPVNDLKRRAEKLLKEKTLDDDDKNEITECLAELDAAVLAQKNTDIEQWTSKLEDILFFLEQ